MTAASRRLPLVAVMSPKPHVERVVVTKYIAVTYCSLKFSRSTPRAFIQDVS